jgi:hypothetical protein
MTAAAGIDAGDGGTNLERKDLQQQQQQQHLTMMVVTAAAAAAAGINAGEGHSSTAAALSDDSHSRQHLRSDDCGSADN